MGTFGRRWSRKDKKDLQKLSYTSIHMYMRKKLVTDDTKCETCKITNLEHKEKFGRGIDLHCKSGVYHDESPDNWSCLCHSCHRKMGKHSHYSKESQLKLKHKLNGSITSKRDYPNLCLVEEV